MGGLLTTNASGTSLASYYYVQDGAMRIFDFWNVDGASAGFALTASVVEAGSGSGDFSGGLVFSSDNIAIPPGAQSIQACAAVVYDTECFDVSLLGYLVAEIESSLTALVLDNATQTLLEVSSPLTSLASTSVRVRPSPACLAAGDSTVTYAKDAAGSVLAFKIGGELSFSTTAAVVDVYLRCNGVLSTLSVDVTALRVPEPVRTCTVGDTTYQPGALMYVNSSTGSNCTCNYGQVYCAEGSGGVGVEGTAQDTNVSVPLPILLALIGGLVLLCACIALSVWRTNRLREEQDRLSTEEGKEVDLKRLNIHVLKESIATGMVFELPNEDRRATLASSRASTARMSEKSKKLMSGKWKSGKLPTVASATSVDIEEAEEANTPAEGAEPQVDSDTTSGVELAGAPVSTALASDAPA